MKERTAGKRLHCVCMYVHKCVCENSYVFRPILGILSYANIVWDVHTDIQQTTSQEKWQAKMLCKVTHCTGCIQAMAGIPSGSPARTHTCMHACTHTHTCMNNQ